MWMSFAHPRDEVRIVRLLVVEDEVRMAALLKRGLEEEGYAAYVRGSKETADA